VNLLSAALEGLLLLDKAEQRLTRIWIAQGPVVHEIVVHRARLDRNAQVEASVHHLSHLIERLFEKHAADIELDLGILEPGELVQDRLHRFARARDRRHPVHGNMDAVEARGFEACDEFPIQEKPVGGHAHLAKAEGFCVTDHLHNIRMLERFAPLQTETGDAQLPDVVHPFLEIGQGRMRKRVVVLVAVVAIQVALLCHIELRNPRLGIENPDGLREILEHSYPYRSRGDGVKLPG